MRTVRTVRMLSGSDRERHLLRSRLTLFGRREDVHWTYVESGEADVAVLSADNPSLEMLREAGGVARVVVFQARESDGWGLLESGNPLERHFLLMLEQWEEFYVRKSRVILEDTLEDAA